jgi:hypothetical protein
VILIPLTSDVCQTKTCTLDGAEYDLTVKWGEVRGAWTMDLSAHDDGTMMASGATLQLGCDILEGFGLGIGSLILLDTTGTDEPPTDDDGDLGTRCKLFYFAPDEVVV